MLTGKQWMMVGAVLSAVSVGAGAFGAHALKEVLTPERLETFKTAVNYLQWHAIGLLAIGWLLHKAHIKTFQTAATLMFAGIVLFCGSLFALVLTDTPLLGAITPFGGVLFIASWCTFAWGIRKL